MNPISIRKTLIASSIALTFGGANAEAALVANVLGANTWYTDSANFTTLADNGGVIPVFGTNDVAMSWDGNAYNSSTDYIGPGSAVNVTISSTTPFFSNPWTAPDIQVFTPGTYSFDVTLGGGNPETGILNATVGAGQLGMHMLFDWNGNNNIDMFMVLAQNSIFGSGILYSTQPQCDAVATTVVQNCLYDGGLYGSAGHPVANEVWMLASVDGNGDGIMGIPMAANGPLAGYTANINANLTPTPKVVPVPAAMWLFGSGLIGLVGLAKRRKQ